MQCDPYCSNYDACVPACPVETCDTIFEKGKDQRMCLQDSCVEGCKLKPCEKGYIYKNSSYIECVPERECNNVCIVDGVTYKNGENIPSSLKCEKCVCHNGKKECNDEPCTITTIKPTICYNISMIEPHPQDCFKYIVCEKRTTGEYEQTVKVCAVDLMFNTVTNRCAPIAQVQNIRDECFASTTSPQSTTESETYNTPICEPGYKLNDCKNPCENACHYYERILQSKGLCKVDKNCERSCIRSELKLSCPAGYFRNNNFDCVSEDQCLCMSFNGTALEPFQVVDTNNPCEQCQCIFNKLTCKTWDDCKTTTPKSSGITTPPMFTKPRPTTTTITTTLTPLSKCISPFEYTELINGDNPLPDSIFNASSSADNSVPANARLDLSSAWLPDLSDSSPTLKITLPTQESIYGIEISGNPRTGGYVKQFYIYYSVDSKFYHTVQDQPFHVLNNPYKPIKVFFEKPFDAKIIEIVPSSWNIDRSIQVDLIGCKLPIEKPTTPSIPITRPRTTISTSSLPTTAMPIICNDPMGIDNGYIQPNQISASSRITPNSNPVPEIADLIKPSTGYGWRPITKSDNEYIQVNLCKTYIYIVYCKNGKLFTNCDRYIYYYVMSNHNFIIECYR